MISDKYMMKMVALFLCLYSFESTASVNKSLTAFFHKMGSASNISRAGAYQDQRAGYYTGGNLFARNQVFHTQLATLQVPDYKAGCGGIDMFMGSFSHLGSGELIKAMKTIGSNMASYALLLSLETMSPMVKNIITELNDLAQKINQSNVNSCELAATTLGSVWPRSNASQGHLCKSISLDKKYGRFSDYAAARQGCGASGERDSVIRSAQNDPRFKSMLGTEFNLAWKAIQENAFLREDLRLAEFFMSISGTIVSRKDRNGNYHIYAKSSLANKDKLLSVLLHGGEVKIYRCSDTRSKQCLVVKERTIRINPERALVEKVRAVLRSIQDKIYADEPLSKAEIDFLGSTRLPFYKIINVSTAFRRGGSPMDIISYAELGAVDILFQYLSEILDVIHESVDHIRLNQVDDTQLKYFQKSLGEARRQIYTRRTGSFKQMQQVISIVHEVELLEKSLLSKAGTLSTDES